MKKLTFFLIIIIFATGILFADLITSIKLIAFSGISRDSEQEIIIPTVAQAELSFKSTGSREVRAELELGSTISGELSYINISRAFLKVRFPGFRITAGKTRVSWGEGFLFNAGDVIFNGMSLSANFDITAEVLRDETDWLLDLYIPLGQFSHIEAIALPIPPGFNPETDLPSLEKLRGGGRIMTKLLGLKIEAGYIFDGDQIVHLPYVSFEGNLLFQVHISSSLEIPAVEPTEEDLKQGWAISFGLFKEFPVGGTDSLTLRMEGALRPFASWEEVTPPDADTQYGLLLYPEIIYSPEDVLSFNLRALFSPVDLSGLVSLGMNFNIYQGFTIMAFASCMFGDNTDLYFGWGKQGDISFVAGLQYIF